MTMPAKPNRYMVVSAKNRVTSALETRRFDMNKERITKEDAIARMGWWLNQLGWHHKHIMITGAGTHVEDAQSQRIRTRLIG